MQQETMSEDRQNFDSYPSHDFTVTIDDSSTEGESIDEHHLKANTSSLSMLLELSHSGGSFHTSQEADLDSSSFEIDHPLHVDTGYQDPPDAIKQKILDQDNDESKTPKSGNINKFYISDECSSYRIEMNAIDGFLKSHHETRIGMNDDGDETIATDVSMDIEDYVSYMQINAACPNAIRHSFLYCLRNNDLNLCDRILRDIGIEYVLRHCLLYDGVFTTRSESEKNKPTIQTSCANMFWLAAFHGSADVLEMMIEECWMFFVEQETGGTIEPSKEVEQRADDNICLLLNKDVSVYDCTPLFIAAAQNHAAVIRVFLKFNVDPNEENKKGTTAAIVAASRDNLSALEALGENDDIDFNKKNVHGISALLAACQYGAVNSVRFLTHFTKDEKESIINARAIDLKGFGCTALAARYNRKEVVEYLCQIHNPDNDLGVDINQRAEQGQNTALHIAVRYECKETISTFMQMIPREIDSHLRNNSGMTPLHIAASEGYTEIVKAFTVALKDEIKDLDRVDNKGTTPLFYASLKGYKDIVTLLAPHSDVNRLCNIPVTKKQIDSKRQEDNDITYDESGIDTTPNDSNNNMNSHKKTITVQMSALVAAVKKNHVDIIYTLLYCGANPNQTDHRGYTALSHAAQYGHLEIVEILVTHGADVRVRSKGGKLPIHKAKKNKHFHVVEYLEKCAP